MRVVMKIVVIGGSGLIGEKLVTKLHERGHEAVAASPSSGVNAVTGAGLADVLVDAEVVVDVTNSPSFEDAAVLEFFEKSSRNLLAAEADAGVRHHDTRMQDRQLGPSFAYPYFPACAYRKALDQALRFRARR